jgi:hypothetical protein
MVAYWLLLLALAIGSIFNQSQPSAVTGPPFNDGYRIRSDVPLIFALIAITLMIGLRYKVGGDWDAYEHWFAVIPTWPLSTALHEARVEPGYTAVNWLVGQLEWQLWVVNLVCAVPFVVGLASFCRLQPNPWLALAVAAPLFVIVVGMGYTRQATAAGFMLIGLSGLMRGRRYWRFLVWTLIGSLFHQSVLVVIPLVPLFLLRLTPFSILLLIAAAVIGYFVLLPHVLDRYSYGYIKQVYVAKGAIFRIGPNAVTGLLLLGFRKQFEGNFVEVKIWRGFAWLSLLVFAAFFFVRSTVILDRLSVFILPLQIWVWSRLPTAFGERDRPHLLLTTLVIAYSAVVLGLWLGFANHSRYWLPYQLYPVFDPPA